ncbi:MAG: TonB-dependent receptor, partial [Bacteroidia bacterium]|nr:TonB-dependent receptor [Bacteroidia bacterium]
FIVSARRTFIDLFLRRPFLAEGSDVAGNIYYFYDLNTKINYKLSDKDRLFLSGYFGRDVFRYQSPKSSFKVNVPWGNATGCFRWNHLFSDKMFMNTSLIYTDYNFEFNGGQQEFEFKLFSGITDYTGKVDFTYYPNIKHTVRFGMNYIFHEFVPSNASARSGNVIFDFGKIIKQYAHDGALYVSDEFDVSDKLRLLGGLRATYFQQVGPFKRFVRNELQQVVDTIDYASGENVKTYAHVEPRFAMRYNLNATSSLKASFTENFQYIHLASLSSVSLPTDVWVPSSSVVKPQEGTQYSLGYFRIFLKDQYETSFEVYYKEMKNQIEYRDGALPEDNVNDNADNNFVFGKGQGYGAELFLKRNYGRWNGWIGYTLSWTNRQFDDLNFGKQFYAKYDRRHDVSIVFSYEFSQKWTFGLTWVYATGNSLTLPVARYFINGNVVYEYGERNGYRMIPYHRLDISATLFVKKKKKWESSWNFSVFNVYNRANPYFIYFEDTGSTSEGTLKLQAKQVSLFPVLPSVTYNFKF